MSNTRPDRHRHPSIHVDIRDAALDDLRRRETVFPGEQYQAPRSWAEHANPNLIYFNEIGRGGYVAPWEQPQLCAEEIRAAFRPLR